MGICHGNDWVAITFTGAGGHPNHRCAEPLQQWRQRRGNRAIPEDDHIRPGQCVEPSCRRHGLVFAKTRIPVLVLLGCGERIKATYEVQYHRQRMFGDGAVVQ